MNTKHDSLLIQTDEIKVEFKNFHTHNYVSDQITQRLLSAFLIRYCEASAQERKSLEVHISLTEYMQLCGLKNRKEAIKRAKNDLDAIVNTWFSAIKGYKSLNIADFTDIKRDDVIIKFGSEFAKMVEEAYIMPFPHQMWTLNVHKNPNSRYLLRLISTHKNMNYFKPNADILFVATLLEKAIYIPTLQEVKTDDRHYERRIIDPFERDMNALADTFSWHYQDADGNRIDNVNSYQEFIKLRVHIRWHDYPVRTLPKQRKRKS